MNISETHSGVNWFQISGLFFCKVLDYVSVYDYSGSKGYLRLEHLVNSGLLLLRCIY